jgi:hypothetical protein
VGRYAAEDPVGSGRRLKSNTRINWSLKKDSKIHASFSNSQRNEYSRNEGSGKAKGSGDGNDESFCILHFIRNRNRNWNRQYTRWLEAGARRSEAKK